MKNICRPLLLVVLFSWCAQVTMAQTDKFLEILNRRGFYRPALQWLEDENQTGAIVVVEEHNLSGGVGSAVSEVLMDAGVSCKFKRLGLPDVYVTKIGCQRWLCEEYGIGPTGIKAAINGVLGQ